MDSQSSSNTNASGIVHNTLAGNRLDPRIEADGHMGTGEGVGGTSERHIKREGIEHIKQETFGSSNTTGTADSGLGSGSTTTATTGSGIGSGVGSGIGSSSTGYDSTPSHSATHDHTSTTGSSSSTAGSGGMVDTVKSYLGFGGASSTTTSHSTDPTSTSPSTATSGDYDNTSSNTYDRQSVGSRPNESVADSSSNTMTDSSEHRHSTHPETSISGNHTGPGHHEHNTTGDKGTTATTDSDQAGAGPGDVGESHKRPEPASGKPRHLENPSAIPTAGGERLGEKHWGESKVVPDLPPQEGEGVSSREGQPTGQVRDNTAANTGSATAGPHAHGSSTTDHAEKEGLADKVKHSLHMGGK